MPDITLGSELGNAATGAGGGGAVIILREILAKLIFRNGKGNASKEFVGEKMDKLRQESKENLKEALAEYPRNEAVKLLLQGQLIDCSKRFQEIKDVLISAIRSELAEHRAEYRQDIDRVHSRLDDMAKK